MLIKLFLISLLTRLAFLFFGFPSITHDEADFYLNGYMLSKTGSDIHNNSLFLSSGILSSISPIPVYISALFFTFLPKTIITGRLPFAILNSLIPVLIYYIINKLTSNKKLAFFTFLVANFSPWLVHVSSQAAFDSPLSFMFYLAATASLLSNIRPKLKTALFISLMFLSFNSYMGIKVSFFFLVLIAFVIKGIYERKKLDIFFWGKPFFYSLLVFVSFMALVFVAPGNNSFRSRIGREILLFDKGTFEHTVWYERYVMKTPEIIKKFVSNKATVFTSMFIDKYLVSFDPRILFFKGDPHPLYGTYYFGLFYLFEFAFLILGFFKAQEILGKKVTALLPFFLLLLVSPIPVGLSTSADVTFIFRAYPLLLPFSFLIALGGYYLISLFKKYFYVLSIGLYLIAFGYFFFIYQVKIKAFSSEQWHYSQKILSDRIEKLRNEYDKVYVFTNEPRENTLLYNYYQARNGNLIKKSITQATDRDFEIENVYIRERCPIEKLDERNFYIIKRDVCDIRKNKAKSADYKLTPYIEAYDHSGTVYWQLTNLEKDK